MQNAKMQKCKKKADIIATAAHFFSKGLKGLKGFKGFKGLKGFKGFKDFKDFKVPYRSDKAHTEGSTGSGHAAEGGQQCREQLPQQPQK